MTWDVPFGAGVKYQARKWMAWRVEVTDNLAIAAAGLDTMHNISITMGVEAHFGGRRFSFFPWSPGAELW